MKDRAGSLTPSLLDSESSSTMTALSPAMSAEIGTYSGRGTTWRRTIRRSARRTTVTLRKSDAVATRYVPDATAIPLNGVVCRVPRSCQGRSARFTTGSGASDEAPGVAGTRVAGDPGPDDGPVEHPARATATIASDVNRLRTVGLPSLSDRALRGLLDDELVGVRHGRQPD